MKRIKRYKGRADCREQIKKAEARIAEAKARAERAEARIAQAKTRAESAETRAERAETRTESAKTRTEQAEIRAEQAEMVLQRVVQNEIEPPDTISSQLLKISSRLLKNLPLKQVTDSKDPVHQLTPRQREILQLIAQGQNTKQIADILRISSKTVEYHRMKLMSVLHVHDVPGLVRLALREGLVPPEI